MSENRSNPPRMDVNEIKAAIGGPTAVPHQPEGGSNVVPLNPTGLDKTTAEPFPVNVEPQQGAGSGGYLTPGAQPGSGTILVGGNAPDSSGAPEQRPTLSGIPRLTAGQINRPSDGSAVGAVPSEAPGAPSTSLSAGGGTGQGLNPALGWMPKTRPGQVK